MDLQKRGAFLGKWWLLEVVRLDEVFLYDNVAVICY